MRKINSFLPFCLLLVILTSAQGPAPAPQAVNEKETPPANSAPAVPQMLVEDVGAFLDGIIPQQIARDNIAGATVAVVKDGKVLFSKGYGYADVGKKQPVLPEKTLFRPGSISKLFTWTAVMQQVEQGKLDLKKDVNEYLDFKIPDAFGKPITLENIMTHTPGFEEQVKDLFSVGESPNLGEYLKTHIPARIFPPGTTPAYSNYATALAGYIVERVSGTPFNKYIEDNIFKPLGMNNSSFAQPLPENLAGNMSNGYRLASEPAVTFEVVSPFPAGSLSSTAEDMSKFMIAHLQNGEYNGARILKPETAKLMHSRLFALDDAALGMAHGFYEESRNGLRIIGHGGDTIAFHSDLHLIPEKNVGFFISYNSAGKGEVSDRTMLWDAFVDRYYPYTPPAGNSDGAKEEAQSVVGNYIGSRRSEKSFLRTAAILGEATVAANPDNTISVGMLTDASGLPKKWERIAPMTFRDVKGQDLLIFKPDSDGKMRMILNFPFMIFTKAGFLDNSKILLPVLVISLAIMALTLILTPIAWLVRRHYASKLDLTSREKWLRRGVWIVFILDLATVIGLTSLLTYALSHIEFLGDTGRPWFHLFQIIGILGAIGTILVVYNAVEAWMSSRYRIWGKLGATLLVFACIGFLWFAYAGNLLIPRMTY